MTAFAHCSVIIWRHDVISRKPLSCRVAFFQILADGKSYFIEWTCSQITSQGSRKCRAKKCIQLIFIVNIQWWIWISNYRPPSEGWRKVIFSVCPRFGGGGGACHRSQIFVGGGPRSQIFFGGAPGLRFSGRVPGLRFWGGSQVSDFFGGVPSLRFSGGRGWYLVSLKGKIFDTRFGLIHVQTRKKIFVEGPPPSKGKNFWHQIWLDTCSDWGKFFLSRDPPPPPPTVKGNIFDTRFGLIHVQTRKKYFCQGTPPPPNKGKNFWHQIWLDTCSDWGKKILSRDPPPPPE